MRGASLTLFARHYWTGQRTRYIDSLRAGRPGVRTSMESRYSVFSISVQTGSGAHPASSQPPPSLQLVSTQPPASTQPSCTQVPLRRVSGSFSGVQLPSRGVTHPPPSSVGFKHECSYTSTPPYASHGMLRSDLYLIRYCQRDQLKRDQMGRTCHVRWKTEMYTRFWW